MPFGLELELHLRITAYSLLISPMQVMVTNVTSLLKTVKAVEDEATRGTRALEATIEYIKQELTVSSQQLPPSARSPCTTYDCHTAVSLHLEELLPRAPELGLTRLPSGIICSWLPVIHWV